MLLKWWTKNLDQKLDDYSHKVDWPKVSVLMAAYNEESVIEEKMQSLMELDYPKDKLNFYIGSDCSSDQTNAILSAFAKKEPRLRFFPFTERQGKPGVVNKLSAAAYEDHGKVANHLFLLTDASVMLEPQTLKKLSRHFKDSDIALVDTNILGTNLQQPGISKSENSYVSAEARLKNREGILWGTMIGPFGGCFLLRSNFYHEVPTNFLVDDFYIAFKAMLQGGKAINDLDAICYEAISQDIKEEFRRKVRISTGNFQNLATFAAILKKPFSPLGFAFLSHKVLRWLGPFFIIISFLIALFFAFSGNWFYGILLLGFIAILFVIPLLDKLLHQIDVHITAFRHVRYFVAMNRALFVGFFKYLSGVEKGTWEPTKRVGNK